MWYNPGSGAWQDIPATVNLATRTVTVEGAHFSIYALVWTVPEKGFAGAEGTPAGSPVGETGPAFPVPALVLVVVLIAALAAFLVMRKK